MAPLNKTGGRVGRGGATLMTPSESALEVKIHAEATKNVKKTSGWLVTLHNEQGPINAWFMSGPDPREGSEWHKIQKLVSSMWKITVVEVGILTPSGLQERVERAVLDDLTSRSSG